MKKNIVLTGFMGTGKTAVSRLISEKLNKKLLSLDDMIEERARKVIADIFKEDGELAFRALESEVVKLASKNEDLIIDAGGGVIVDEGNYNSLKRSGVIFSLSASVDEIFERTKHFTHRPLLNKPDPKKAITELLDKRQIYYSKADYNIDTTSLSIEEVADIIIKYMELVKNEDR